MQEFLHVNCVDPRAHNVTVFIHHFVVHVICFFSDPPNPRQFTAINDMCDTSAGSYVAMITFNDNETGGADIVSYQGTLLGGSITRLFTTKTNTIKISGLECSTTYNISVTATNCANTSEVSNTSFDTSLPGELCIACTSIHVYTLSVCKTSAFKEYWGLSLC